MSDVVCGRRCGTVLATVVVMHLGTGAIEAHAKLRFHENTDLPGIGLNLRLMPNARQKPLPPPHANRYRLSDRSGERLVDMFAPRDLWLPDQHAGEWEDADGTALVIGIVRYPLPDGFSRPHCMREEYEARVEPTRAPDAWTSQELTTWVSDFAGSEAVLDKLDGSRPKPRHFRELHRFRFPNMQPPRTAYAFRLAPDRRVRAQPIPDNWFVALFALHDPIPVRELDTTIERRFLPYVTAMRNLAAPTRSPSIKFQANRSQVSGGVSETFKASRRRVAESIANLEEWWFVETDHYIILSNMKASQRVLVKRLQTNIERLWQSFSALIPAREPISAVSVIRIFATDREYLDYVGPDFEWTGGMWVPARRELVVRPLDAAGSHEQRERIMRSTYHEAFHQYLHYALGEISPSLWYNEGHAVLFEHAEVGHRGVTVGEPEALVKQVKQILSDGSPRVADIVRMSQSEFYTEDPETRQQHYALAWGLVYYIRKGQQDARHDPYAGLLSRYTDTFRETRDAAQTDATIFDPMDMAALERELVRFWNSPGKRNAARRKKLTP